MKREKNYNHGKKKGKEEMAIAAEWKKREGREDKNGFMDQVGGGGRR